jgi:transglutaminase-like putative cysteine protease
MSIRWWRTPVLIYPLLVTFCWSALELWRLPEAWAQEPPPRPARQGTIRRDGFAQPLKELRRLSKQAEDAQRSGGDLSTAMANLLQARQTLLQADQAIRAEFAATEQKLRQANLPAEILQRHADAVQAYETKLHELDTHLTDAEQTHGRIADPWNVGDRTADHARLKERLSKVEAFLEKHLPKTQHRPLDPNRLPHRPAVPRWKVPQTSSRILPTYALPGSPWLAAQEELDPAYVTQVAASNDTLVAQVLPKGSGLPPTPTAADLALTDDVQITQELRDIVAELNNDPVRIYEYVRNSVDFEPTWGSIKGSVLTLWEKSGNAFDTASLLIALLRAANIPARYVLGTIQVPAAQAQNWVGGVVSPQLAATILASGGVPVSYSATHVTLEHVWVEAYLPFAHYRGVPLGQSGKTWIPLDASFKQYTYTQGLDAPAIVGFEANSFIQQAQAGATIDPVTGSATNINQIFIESEMTRLRQLLQTHIETNLPTASLADIIGGRSITSLGLGVLPATLPYRTLAATSDTVALPDSVRHHVTIALLDEFGLNQVASVTRSLPQVATQKITVSYGPASDVDRLTLESLASQQVTSIPAYLIRLVPEIRIDEVVVATGPSIGMGKDQAILVTLEGPNQPADQLRHDRIVGDYSLLGLELGNSSGRRLSESRARLLEAKSKLERQELAGITKQNVVGELLNTTTLAYWAELNFFTQIAGSFHRVVPLRLPSEALVSYTGGIAKVFDAPLSAEPGGLAMDVKRSLLTPVSRTGDKRGETTAMLMLGVIGSYLEGNVFEQAFQSPHQGVSAVHLLRLASAQGVPVYQVNRDTLTANLPRLVLPLEVLADIQNAVAAGQTVYVPATELTINGWTGTGYIVLDPATGAGAFRISGGLAGAEFWMEVSRELLWASLFLLGLGIGLSFLLSPLGLLLAFMTGLAIAFIVGPLLDAVRRDKPLSLPWPSAKDLLLNITNAFVQMIFGAFVFVLLTTPLTAPVVLVILLLVAIMAGFDYLINHVRLLLPFPRELYAHRMLRQFELQEPGRGAA